MDPTTVQVILSRLGSICEEMLATLVKASYSTNIKERMDCSTAVFDAAGTVVAMPSDTTIPIHLSSLDDIVKAVLKRHVRDEIHPGDMFVANDPYAGGSSHLPDISMAAPVFTPTGKLLGFVANVAHHSDIANASPTGRAIHLSTIHQEGLRIPPTRIVGASGLLDDIVALISLNSRTPQERMGDLRAQIAANRAGVESVLELLDRFGEEALVTSMQEIIRSSERRLRATLTDLPDGVGRAEDYIDNDGIDDHPVCIRVEVVKQADTLRFDFSGSSNQVQTAINAPIQATRAVVWCVVKSLIDPSLPPNGGFHRPITIEAPVGSIVNCSSPAATAERMITAYVLGDVVARALAALVPHESVASYGSQMAYGTGCVDPRTGHYVVEYQAFAGGQGATAFSDGMDTVGQWSSGAPNAPVEADEIAYPIVVEQYELRDGSGGHGQYRGGLGIRRVFRIYGDDSRPLTTVGTRMTVAPPGLFGGGDGKCAAVVVNPGTDSEERLTKMVTDYLLAPGDVVEVLSAGGGGCGDWLDRDPQAIQHDLDERRILPDEAQAWLQAIAATTR